MPSKKLPNRAESLFDAAHPVAKDAQAESRPVEPRLPQQAIRPAADESQPLDAPQAMAGWTWETDSAGSQVYCSPEVKAVLGYSPEELRGKTLSSLAGGAANHGAQTLAEALRTAKPFADLRLRATRKDGRTVILISTGYPIRDESGRLVGFHGVSFVAAPPVSVELPPAAPVKAAEQPVAAKPPAALAGLVPAVAQPPAVQPAAQPPAAVVQAAAQPPAPAPARLPPLPTPPLPLVAAAYGYLDGPEGLAPMDEDIVIPEIDEAIRRGQLIHKVSDLPAGEGEAALAGRTLAAPIKLQNQILGALDFFDMDHSKSWSEDDLALAQTVADQLGLALENARLFNETRIQQRNATQLARATQSVARTLSEDDLWNGLADELVVAYHPYSVAISQWDSAAGVLTPMALRGESQMEVGLPVALADRPGAVGQVIRSGQGTAVALTPSGQTSLRTAMIQPLLYNDVLECLVEVTSDRADAFTADDLRLLGSILFAAASALRTVRLYDLQRQTNERLTELDRVKSQFLANMSHELRTPLNSIIGFSRVILKGIDGPLTEQQGQDLTSIYNSGRHLLELINDILDMSKIEAGKMEMIFEEVDLREVFRGVMSTTSGLVKDKPGIQLLEELADPLPTVSADATRVRQVMMNLVSNAAKFTEAGSITLRAQTVEEREPRTDQFVRFVQISVIDTGSGIAEKDMHKLFEAFSQVDASPTRKVGGTGLGLSICRRMIELHGGRIWAESEIGRGSNFSFTLPVYQKETPPPPEAGQAAPPTVLVVEDDQGLVGLYRRYLEPHGYKVVAVDKSTDTLSRTAIHRPVAIVLDVIMPNRDGWQVLADLKENESTRLIPVIVCTIVSDRERAMRLGAADYLNKPILEADLLQALEKALSLAGRPQEAPAGAA
jgi:PAS domain S-box-containing protein